MKIIKINLMILTLDSHDQIDHLKWQKNTENQLCSLKESTLPSKSGRNLWEGKLAEEANTLVLLLEQVMYSNNIYQMIIALHLLKHY